MRPDSLHQEVILRHFRHSAHRGGLEAPDAEITVQNPTCGDEIILRLLLREGVIEVARFQGEGCAISQASASMMARQVEGRTLADAEALADRFTAMVRGSEEAARDPALGDLRVLAGVSSLPVRVRCALLPWDALRRAGEQLRG